MPDVPPVRLEIRERGDAVHAVRGEREWPPKQTKWTPLHLAPGELRDEALEAPAVVRIAMPGGRASFAWVVPDDVEIVGPMKLRLFVEIEGARDAHLFAAVRKFASGEHVPFEGSNGFGHGVVSHGWLRVAHRRVDEARSDPCRPFHPCDRAEPLAPREIAPCDVEMLPSATLFRRGETLRLDVQGRWFWRRNALLRAVSDYAPSPKGTVVLHLGGKHAAHLLVPRQ